MKWPTWHIILTIYLTYFYTYGVISVGTKAPETTYSWLLPYELLGYALAPAAMGYLIRKWEEE